MKKLYSFILITVFSASVFGQTVPSYVPTNGLVGWWPLDGNGNDLSANSNNGNASNIVWGINRFGIQNSAAEINGNSNREVEILNPIGISSNKKTFSTWIKFPTTYANDKYYNHIITAWSASNSLWYQIYGTWPGYVSSGLTNKLGICGTTPLHSNNLNDNQWHHVVYIINGDSSKANLFLDGVNYGKTNLPGNINYNNWTKLVFGQITGSISPAFKSEGSFSGVIDDIGIWNRELTQAEITALYTANGVGIKDQSLNQISIYPNPAKTQITLNATTNQIGKTLKVYDALGKVVYETILKQQQYNINITNWANGIYTVAIPEQGLTYKFVKE